MVWIIAEKDLDQKQPLDSDHKLISLDSISQVLYSTKVLYARITMSTQLYCKIR